MFTLKSEIQFDMAHYLSGYVGKCKNIHGHRYRLVVKVSSQTLHESGQLRGMVDDFSEVKALKDFSMVEYEHARKVSDIASRCAKAVGYNENLCLAGGFYYRMGQWIGDPYVEEGVKKAKSLCFPEDLLKILQEYYGEKKLPSIPESALVHMVDALIVKLDHIKSDVADSGWNHDILIIQLLNELSASGIYDESGLSMNHFLKIRDYLKKEELLK